MFKSINRILKSMNFKEKISISMMLTICVLFLLFSFTTNQIYQKLFLENSSQLILKNYNLIHSNIEKIVDNSKNSCSVIENDDEIYNLISKEKAFTDENIEEFYEDYYKYTRIQNAVAFATETYDIDGISIYTNSGAIYGENGKIYFDANRIKETKWYETLTKNKSVSMFCNSDYFSDEEDVAEGNLYYIKLIRSHINGKNIGAIRITISLNRIEKLFSSDSTDLKNKTFLQNDAGEIITSYDKSTNFDIEQTSKQTIKNDGKSIIICQNITGTNMFLISVTSYKDAMSKYNMRSLFIYIIIAVILIISYKISKLFSARLTRRLTEMMNSMDNVKNGEFKPVPSDDYNDDIETFIHNYNDMLIEFEELLNTQKQHETQKRKLQLKILQEQIKPHFLYNTLELINNAAIINNIPEISETVLELSSFYRISLSQGDEIHCLKYELQHIQLYFSLQNKRAQKHLILEINAPEELLDTKTPKLILQPIMENAYYHAFPVPLNKNNAKIEVTVKRIEDNIIIEFCDNGVGIPYETQKLILETESKNGFGLKNVNERIKLYFGNDYGLSISSIPDTGTTITIKLPYNLS